MRKYSLIVFLAVLICVFSFDFLLAEVKKEGQRTKDFIYDSHLKRDPLMPLVTSTGELIKFNSELSSSDLSLEGIMSTSNDEGIAMINGNLLTLGDTIGPFTVVEITQYYVVLTKGDKEIKLKLKKGD